jgi:hypothetical protein
MIYYGRMRETSCGLVPVILADNDQERRNRGR